MKKRICLTNILAAKITIDENALDNSRTRIDISAHGDSVFSSASNEINHLTIFKVTDMRNFEPRCQL